MQCLRCNSKMKYYQLEIPLKIHGAENAPDLFSRPQKNHTVPKVLIFVKIVDILSLIRISVKTQIFKKHLYIYQLTNFVCMADRL